LITGENRLTGNGGKRWLPSAGTRCYKAQRKPFMSRFMSTITLQLKLRLFIYLGIAISLLNIPVIYFEITKLNQRLVNLELAEDLYNTILEVRRYEKNFLLYHDRESVLSSRFYFQQASELFSKASMQFQKSFLGSDIAQLGKALQQYEKFEKLYGNPSALITNERIETKLRNAGKDVVAAADTLLKMQRRRVSRAAGNALKWPLIFMGAMLVLFLIGAKIIIADVVRPFGLIEKAMQKVAHGDFSPIPYGNKNERRAGHMVAAFNRMVQELESREEQVIHSRKIASLGTLVSGCAHELNNPINNIVLTADVLNSKREMTTERQEQLMGDILNQALRASEIVKNLLEFSRAETSVHKEFDLAALLRETMRIAENHIKLSHVTVHDKIDDNLPRISGNHQGLQQVFLNLITNAVHAMEGGGDLTIRAQRENGNKVKVQVEDTGTGIDESILPHIFDPFFTTKDVGKGTGLGLSVSYGIIKKHGGQIQVQSKPGRGTIFTVTLPVHTKIDQDLTPPCGERMA
jgi:signal transduction histidine kinase